MSLTFKEKELVSVATSVAAGCKPCTNYHFKKVRETGASDEEIKQAIKDAIDIRNIAAKTMENYGFKLLGIIPDGEETENNGHTTRIKELISIAAAFTVNCTSNLDNHIASARTAGITDNEIKWVLDMALFIKGKAASHVDRIAEQIKNPILSREKSENTEGCGCGGNG
jgi:AhpD family alkylhydroperoxidase